MTIIGFAFTKIYAEQKKPSKGNIKISNNIKIEGLEKTNLIFDDKRVALKALFTYKVTYQPAVGSIELQGDILFLQETKQAEALIKEWNNKKALPKKLSASLITHILQKCHVQALILTKDINIPPPIPLPRVTPTRKQATTEEKTTKK